VTDEPAFLRAAAAQPADDTLRLVYADWLDEQGGEAFATQAAFARLQVRRSALDVFDPVRRTLLEEEAAFLQKHKRDWNGRIHRELHRRGLFGLVDARRGLIRRWDYHRGMVSRVTVTAAGLTAHADLVSALGPVQGLELIGLPDLTRGSPGVLALVAGLKVVSVRSWGALLGELTGFAPFREVPVLDLRRVSHVATRGPSLFVAARSNDVSPVVLFRGTTTTRTGTGRYATQSTSMADHVIDPHGKWDALRLWFADFTGEVLDPIRYQGTSR
jgi:uncharacterized protein (TIGR02996 family)